MLVGTLKKHSTEKLETSKIENEKNVLVTGTSTGLGLVTAILFAKNGYKVFATMRNLEKGELIKIASILKI